MHVGAATSADPTRRETHFHASQERYLRKHYGPVAVAARSRGHHPGLRGPRRRARRASAAARPAPAPRSTSPARSRRRRACRRPARERRGADMPVTCGEVLRVVGLATLWLIGVAGWCVGVGYFIPTRPELCAARRPRRVPVRADPDGLRHHPAADGGPGPGQLPRRARRRRPDVLGRRLVLRVLPGRCSSPSGRTRPPCGPSSGAASSTRCSTLFTVIANPYRANVVEWVHAGLLTVGALVVGWSIGREGHARLGLTLILLACSALAVVASSSRALIAVRPRRLRRRLSRAGPTTCTRTPRAASSASRRPSPTPDRRG